MPASLSNCLTSRRLSALEAITDRGNADGARAPAQRLAGRADVKPRNGKSSDAKRGAGAGTDRKVVAFSKAGYSYDDAVLLSRLWGQSSAYDAKVRAGGKLLNHLPVPTRPGQTAWTVSDDAALQAYFGNGYDYADAQKLARLWKTASLGDAKVIAGHKLLAGLPLPLG